MNLGFKFMNRRKFNKLFTLRLPKGVFQMTGFVIQPLSKCLPLPDLHLNDPHPISINQNTTKKILKQLPPSKVT
jgi:hypothetical protein